MDNVLSQIMDDSVVNDNELSAKETHDNAVKTKKWMKNASPAISQMKRLLTTPPKGLLAQDYLLSELGLNVTGAISFNLEDGEVRNFDIVEISADQIAELTIVPSVNGRDQNDLNEATMNDILPSIKQNGLTFPGIGYRNKDGLIEVLNGSRRRMCCILANQTFKIFVCTQQLSYKEGKYIADLSRLTKKLSHYEDGCLILSMMQKKGLTTAQQAADVLGEKLTTVQFKINAGSLPLELLKCIPAYNSMSASSYKSLHKLSVSLEKQTKDITVKSLIEEANSDILSIIQNEDDLSVVHKNIIVALNSSFNVLIKAKVKVTPKPLPLHEFSDPNKSATILTKKNSSVITLRRIPLDKVARIEQMISDILKEE